MLTIVVILARRNSGLVILKFVMQINCENKWFEVKILFLLHMQFYFMDGNVFYMCERSSNYSMILDYSSEKMPCILSYMSHQ